MKYRVDNGVDLERTHWGMGMRAWNAGVGEHEARARKAVTLTSSGARDWERLSVLATELNTPRV